MAKDYATAKVKTSSPTQARSVSQTVAMWVSTILLIFLFALGLFFLSHQDEMHDMKQPLAKIQKRMKPQQKIVDKPKFEFYNILTAEKAHAEATRAKVNTQERPITRKPDRDEAALQHFQAKPRETQRQTRPQTSSLGAPVREAVPTDAHRYYLQVASFRSTQDAERLKTKLSLAGYHVDIHPGTVNGQTWHRVFVGPYRDKLEAVAAQTTLARYKLRGLIRDLS